MPCSLRFALRSLRAAPGFTATSVLTLALGLGATTAIFSVLYAVLLKPFPYPDVGQIVVLWQRGPQMEMSIAWPTVQDWQREQQAFSALAVHRRDRFNLSDPGQLPDSVVGAYASPEIFAVALLPPVAGRYFSAEENLPGAEPVVVLSERVWDRRFGRRPDLVGSTIRVDGVPRTVVGIAPAELNLPRLAEVWVPIGPYAATQRSWQSRGNNPGLYSFARLKPGLTLAQGAADLERIYTGLRAAYPDTLGPLSARVEAYADNQVAGYRPGLWALLTATGFVLAIACANVAGLFITRGIARQRDYAIRSALGATRGALVRQMLLEALLVAVAGGALALPVAAFALEGIGALVPAGQVRFHDLSLDGWVLAFAALTALASGLLAGLWPALRLARPDLLPSLHAGGRGATSGTTARRLLVGAQVALTVVLLGVTGLMLRSLAAIHGAELGFDRSSVLRFSLALPASRYAGTGTAAGLSPTQTFYLQLLEDLRALPGVSSVSASTNPPLRAWWQSSFAAEGHHQPADRNKPLAEMNIISDDYFATLGVPLVAGRTFGPQDRGAPRVVIIDQAFARRYWPGEDALGRRIHWGVGENDEENWFTVVGVVPTLQVHGYGEPPGRPQAYWSLHQFSQLQKNVLVRTATAPRLLERPVREALARLDAEVAPFDVTTLDEEVASTYETTALQSLLLSLFAGLALVLALIGLYSVVAYGVSLRRREIGVRLALGAEAAQVVGVMLRQGLVPLACGLVLGLAGALAAGHALASQLYRVPPGDPLVLASTLLLLALVATLACLIPARRAARVNPVEALRAD